MPGNFIKFVKETSPQSSPSQWFIGKTYLVLNTLKIHEEALILFAFLPEG